MNTKVVKKFLYAPALFTALALIATSECLSIGAEEHTEQLTRRVKVKQISDCITRFRDGHRDAAEKFIDITYRELVSDPMEVVQRIYERLDIPLTEVAAERMRQLATARSRYQKPVASPTLVYIGLDPTAPYKRSPRSRDQLLLGRSREILESE
jgi:hypothetical protein